jgi:formate/nitrite transporter FocA (FNT family)
VVSLGHFPHIVAGSTDATYAMFSGRADVRDYLLGFLAPTLFGNTIGGVALAAILNHAPVAHDLAAHGQSDIVGDED